MREASFSLFFFYVGRGVSYSGLPSRPLRSNRNRRYIPRQRFQQTYARAPGNLRDSTTSTCSLPVPYSPSPPFPPLTAPPFSPSSSMTRSSTASHSIGKRKITRPMTSRASSAVTSPICLCVGPTRARASLLSFSPSLSLTSACFLLTQEPVIPYDLYFPVRISRF